MLTVLFTVALVVSGAAAQSCNTVFDCLDASAVGQSIASLGCSGGTCQGCNTANGWSTQGSGCGCGNTFLLTGEPRINWQGGNDQCQSATQCDLNQHWQCSADGSAGPFCNSGGSCACLGGFTAGSAVGGQVTCSCSGQLSWANNNGFAECISGGSCLASHECGVNAECVGASTSIDINTPATQGSCQCTNGGDADYTDNTASYAGCSCPNVFPDLAASPRIDWSSGQANCLGVRECIVGQDWHCSAISNQAYTGQCNAGTCGCQAGFIDCAASGTDPIDCQVSC